MIHRVDVLAGDSVNEQVNAVGVVDIWLLVLGSLLTGASAADESAVVGLSDVEEATRVVVAVEIGFLKELLIRFIVF